MLLAGMATTGCEPSYNEYYVRYAVGIEPGDVVNINYQDTYNHHGEITGVVKEAEVEGIVGPVYGGFKANITATVNDGEAPCISAHRGERERSSLPHYGRAERRNNPQLEHTARRG